jgi:hypothetical protein
MSGRFFFLFLVICVLSVSGSSSMDLDSILDTRQNLRNEYYELISSPRASPNTENQIFYLQNRLIENDDLIIDNYLRDAIREKNEANDLYNMFRLRNQKLEAELAEVSSFVELLTLALIISTLIIIILTILLIIKIRWNSRKGKKGKTEDAVINTYKKRINDLEVELDNLKKSKTREGSEIEDLRIVIEEYEKKANENHLRIIQLKNDNQKLIEETEQLRNSLLTPQPGSSNEISNAEILALEHQLHDARANLEILTETNNSLSLELEQLIHRERELDEEKNKFQDEINELKKQKEELAIELKNVLEITHENEKLQLPANQETENEKLNAKIEIYKNRLEKEEKARQKLEKEVFDILKQYQDYIDNL